MSLARPISLHWVSLDSICQFDFLQLSIQIPLIYFFLCIVFQLRWSTDWHFLVFRQFWSSFVSQMDPCRSRRKSYPLQVFSCAGPCFMLFSVEFSFPSRSTFVSRHCNLPPSVFLPSCFPFLHWNRQKSFRALPRIVWFISFFVEKVDKYPHTGNIVLDPGKDFWLGAIYMHSYDLLMVK